MSRQFNIPLPKNKNEVFHFAKRTGHKKKLNIPLPKTQKYNIPFCKTDWSLVIGKKQFNIPLPKNTICNIQLKKTQILIKLQKTIVDAGLSSKRKKAYVKET